MSIKRRYLCLLMAAVLAISACTSRTTSLPSVRDATGNVHRLMGAGHPQQLFPNTFAAAQGKNLSDADLDNYINARLSPQDRALAHKLMKFMPVNQRGDFVAVTSDGRIISNKTDLAPDFRSK